MTRGPRRAHNRDQVAFFGLGRGNGSPLRDASRAARLGPTPHYRRQCRGSARLRAIGVGAVGRRDCASAPTRERDIKPRGHLAPQSAGALRRTTRPTRVAPNRAGVASAGRDRESRRRGAGERGRQRRTTRVRPRQRKRRRRGRTLGATPRGGVAPPNELVVFPRRARRKRRAGKISQLFSRHPLDEFRAPFASQRRSQEVAPLLVTRRVLTHDHASATAKRRRSARNRVCAQPRGTRSPRITLRACKTPRSPCPGPASTLSTTLRCCTK